ncbi:MAG: hypothetical protein ABL961_17430 [Vicinamibacterales bacterium]
MAQSWTPVGTWSGSGQTAKETESFTTTKREWRVRWTATTNSERAILRDLHATVHSAEDGRQVSEFIAGRTETAGESYVRGPAGRYYLKIASVNVTWTVTAEEVR